MKYTILFPIIILLSSFSVTKSAEIEASVFVDLQQIDQNIRYNVSSLASDLETYINSTDFTDIQWEGPKIPVDISIALSGGSRNVYSAQIIIISKRFIDGTDNEASIAVKLFDKNWSFKYSMGAVHSYNPLQFDNFKTLIDFYMLFIIGYDADLYGELEGDKIYNSAKRVLMLGTNAGAEGFESYSQPGDFTKNNLINEFMNPRYEEFRKLIFAYFFDGLDLISTKREEALANISGVISQMAEFKKKKLTSGSVMMQMFFESKAEEIANTLRGYKNKQVFDDLRFLDPSNSVIYNEAMDN